MPMSKEEHEALLNELLTQDLEHARRTEILQQLRTDYGTVHADFNVLETNNKNLQKNNDDLIVSNSQLFRQLGVVGENTEKKQEEVQKNFSETVTLELLEK